jgi:hypothetical protein
MSDKTISIYAKLIEFQSELTTIARNDDNPHYKSKFASLGHIQASIQPLLAKHKLGYMFTTIDSGVQCTVFDIDGNKIEFTYPANLAGTAQQVGSAITYAKRYALCAVLGLIVGGEDDDGNEAEKQAPAPKPITLNKAKFDDIISTNNVESAKKALATKEVSGRPLVLTQEQREALEELIMNNKI